MFLLLRSVLSCLGLTSSSTREPGSMNKEGVNREGILPPIISLLFLDVNPNNIPSLIHYVPFESLVTDREILIIL